MQEAYYSTRKNHTKILEFVKQIVSQNPTIRIAFLGKHWEDHAGLCGNNYLFFDAHYRDYPSIYKRAKLFVNMSRQEGGPISLIEAMASGCYVISTPSGFSTEIESGTLGTWLVPMEYSIEKWIEKCITILEHGCLDNPIDMDDRKYFLSKHDFKKNSHNLEVNLFGRTLKYSPREA